MGGLSLRTVDSIWLIFYDQKTILDQNWIELSGVILNEIEKRPPMDYLEKLLSTITIIQSLSIDF